MPPPALLAGAGIHWSFGVNLSGQPEGLTDAAVTGARGRTRAGLSSGLQPSGRALPGTLTMAATSS